MGLADRSTVVRLALDRTRSSGKTAALGLEVRQAGDVLLSRARPVVEEFGKGHS